MNTQKNRRPASLMLWKGGKLPPRLMQQPAFMPQAAMYERLLAASESMGNKDVAAFCREVLKVYDEYDLRGHIVWNPDAAKD